MTDFGREQLRGRDVAFSPDGERLFTSDESDTIQVWNIASGKLESEISQPDASIRSLIVSPDNSRLYVADLKSSEIVALTLPAGEHLSCMRCPAEYFRDIVLSADGKQMFSAHNDGTVFNWNTDSFTLNWKTSLDHQQIREICPSPDGSKLVTISQPQAALPHDHARLRTLVFHLTDVDWLPLEPDQG